MAQIKVSDLTFAYPGSYDNIFEHTSFQFDSDWKLGAATAAARRPF